MSTTEKKATSSDLVKQLTDDMAARYAAVLPPSLKVDRFLSSVKTALVSNPKLLGCTSTSLIAAIMTAAGDGLLPDGKEAVIQERNINVAERGQPKKYQKLATYMPMVRGIIKALYNTGEVLSIDAAAVYEKDEFVFERGDHPRIVHKPYPGFEQPGKVVAAYAIFKLANGEVKREVMFRRDIEQVREAGNGGGWSDWYDQYAIKSVIKRASKQMQTSSERLERIIANDNRAMGFEFDDEHKPAQEAPSAPAEKPAAVPGKPSRLLAAIGAEPEPQAKPKPEPEPEPEPGLEPLSLDDLPDPPGFDDLTPPQYDEEDRYRE